MRLAVSGVGVVTSLGIGKEANLKALEGERMGIGQTSIFHLLSEGVYAGEVGITNEGLKRDLGIVGGVWSRSSLLALSACREALLEALIPCCGGEFSVGDMAFIHSTTVGGIDVTESCWGHYRESCLDISSVHGIGENVEAISSYLGGFGYTTAVSTACSSSLNAVMVGCDLIRSGRYKRVLVGGSDCLTVFHYSGFRSLQILSSGVCRPFDRGRDGLNLGEGAAYLVIESEEFVRERGADILCYIGGYCNVCEAFHPTASSPDGAGALSAMCGALKMASMGISDVDYIHTHGTATESNDSSELRAIDTLCSRGGSSIKPFTSSKSLTGHTTAASGCVSIVFSLLGMLHDFIPCTINVTSPMDGAETLVRHTCYKKVDSVLCNSFGFGGNDSSVLLSRFPIDLKGLDEGEVRGVWFASLSSSEKRGGMFFSGEVRRLSESLRDLVGLVRASLDGCQKEKVDAILCGTRYGCIGSTIKLLDTLVQEGVDAISPSLFMQSTHNVPSTTVARILGCYGYNTTFCSCSSIYDDTMGDVRRQTGSGYIRSALVMGYDEVSSEWGYILERGGKSYLPGISVSLVTI